MSEAIRLENVTKVFVPHRELGAGLKEIVLHPLRVWRQARALRFVAVRDVSFSVRHGETFGVVGRNGAGKSTVLGMISGVLVPSSGTIRVAGRISPLLELGVGFVQELTGRENALLNGVLLGLRRADIESRLEAVLDFAGLRDFADQPLKTYSSGMQSRLGFSVAVHADPEILLVDEVLAVGDLEFQERCLERISELHSRGATILFVSHDMETVNKVCDRAVWLEHGRVEAEGSARDVTRSYVQAVGAAPDTAAASLARRLGPRSGGDPAASG